MNLTEEQQHVVDYAKQADDGELVLIDSVAGSGKTTLLRAIASSLDVDNGLYLAYNKAIATSSQKKFPAAVDCRTTHSLAYRAIVTPMKLKVGFFGPRQITEKLPYKEKQVLTDDIREFCLSSYISYAEYAEACGRVNATLAEKYLNAMSDGKIDCTHDFYLKAFHMALVDDAVDCPAYDLLMLDEAGDLNEVTLEIFKLLPAKLKIAVGDPHQNIYTFNYTINCFERLEGQGKTFKLSKSFRVPKQIAKPMEKFCRRYLNPDMEFEGVDPTEDDINSWGYISRTNSGLISKLIELNHQGVPYGLVRQAKEIFKVPLMVAGLRYQGKIYDPAYKHLQAEVDDWHENKDGVKTKSPGLLGYLRKKFPEDLSLAQAVNLVLSKSRSTIFEAYAEAKNHENKKQAFMLMTAHSSKGLEFDEVILAPDMNTSIEGILEDMDNGEIESIAHLSASEKEALNLYYVASTRALISLRNAVHLIRV